MSPASKRYLQLWRNNIDTVKTVCVAGLTFEANKLRNQYVWGLISTSARVKLGVFFVQDLM